MSDTLFDPTPYGPGTEPRRSTTPRLIRNDGTWYALRRRSNQPDVKAHRVAHKVYRTGGVWEGAYQTSCGLVGAVIKIEGDVELRPCLTCEVRIPW